MPKPKPFQEAAIRAACESFETATGSRRFLVADEVGLGKTVIAQQVIERLAGEHRRSPFVVYYITNGQRVANQNRGRLIDFLDSEAQKEALSKADRLNLIPIYPRPSALVALYALTPGTSFPGKTTRLHAGRKEERAFLAALLGRTCPHVMRKFPADTMKRNVRSGWEDLVHHYRRPVSRLPRSFVYAFKGALIKEFEGPPKTCLPELSKKESAGRFVGRLRRALARAVLIARPPDLVILDEFQRYRDMISEQGRSDPLVSALLEPPGSTWPALLLLSATPYKLFATRLEENRGAEANREFFDLLEFLGGPRGVALKADAKGAFAEFGNVLLAIAKCKENTVDAVRLIEDAKALRNKLQSMLAPYLSRMEREITSDDSANTIALHATLEQVDVRAFRHLASSFKPDHKWFALPYWLSVPLPAQSLGPRYMAWRDATIRNDHSLVKLTVSHRDKLSLPRTWPHPKLRALETVVPSDTLALPWVAPSVSWWDLRGAWAAAPREPKLLLFSRFKSTPQCVAALMSLGVEARYLSRSGRYETVWKRRRLQAAPDRLPVVALFHPSPLLVMATDPLAGVNARRLPPRETVRTQLVAALKKLDVRVVKGRGKKGTRRKPLWLLLSALERLGGYSELTKRAWRSAAREDQRLHSLLAKWHAPRELDWISRRELDDLVTASLSAPGVIIGRALLRHFPQALSSEFFEETVNLAWHGLRTYLDMPVFWALLPKGKPVEVLHRACLDGNLEAVLDEHFWIRRQSLPTRERGLAQDLLQALSVSTGGFSLHSINAEKAPRIRVRCHVAVPFGSTEDDDRPKSGAPGDHAPRSDELRNAFNSPFWPHVLATTSVGQEGLDFHTWCSRVVHWDLCSSPLELEQREGRIQRFGGLAIRRRLGKLQEDTWRAISAMHDSPWNIVESLVDQEHRDVSGLSPWWVLHGAAVSRYVFNLPQSRDLDKFTLLKEQRLIYRLALGQPNQEDLIEFLSKGGPALTATLRPLALNLSAFARTRTSHSMDP